MKFEAGLQDKKTALLSSIFLKNVSLNPSKKMALLSESKQSNIDGPKNINIITGDIKNETDL